MMRVTEQAIANLAHRASEIEALCNMLGTALVDDPEMADAGFALRGIGSLAGPLARDLYLLADPNA